MTTEPPAPPQAPVGDPVMESIAMGVIRCVCAMLTAANRAVCCCKWARGDARPVADGCDCECTNPLDHTQEGQGVMWFRTVQLDNTTSQTAPGGTSWGGVACAPTAQTLRLTFEVGLLRCVQPGDPEEGLDCEDATRIAVNGAWDDRLVREAVACCELLAGYNVRLLQQAPLGPSGACGGSVTTYVCDFPPAEPKAVEPVAIVKRPRPDHRNRY